MTSNNPEYQKRYIRQHYLNNKDYYKEKAKERRKHYRNKYGTILRRYKTMKGCIDCGYKDSPYALEFDHTSNDKIADVAKMYSQQRPWALIKEEVFKCEVRCANCHRVKTAERAGWSTV